MLTGQAAAARAIAGSTFVVHLLTRYPSNEGECFFDNPVAAVPCDEPVTVGKGVFGHIRNLQSVGVVAYDGEIAELTSGGSSWPTTDHPWARFLNAAATVVWVLPFAVMVLVGEIRLLVSLVSYIRGTLTPQRKDLLMFASMLLYGVCCLPLALGLAVFLGEASDQLTLPVTWLLFPVAGAAITLWLFRWAWRKQIGGVKRAAPA
jgi:hypothetical protein